MSVQVTPSNTLRTKFDACRPGFIDRVFKEDSGVEIPVRIWPANKGGEKAGWILWIHGGANAFLRVSEKVSTVGNHFIFPLLTPHDGPLTPGWQSGNPYAIAPWVHPAFGDNYHVISLAYRYIPQCSLMESVQDCKDGFAWLQQNLPSITPGVDIDNYIVAGDSAGGTLAVLIGHHLSPPPKAVLDVYGVVDFLDPRFYAKWPAAIDLSGRDELKARLDIALTDRDKANAAYARPARFHLDLPIETLRSFWGVKDLKIDREEALFQCDLYDYVTSLGKRMTLLFREEECNGREEFDQRCKDHSVIHLIDHGKSGSSAKYPPTYILHGTGDALVPVKQGYEFEEKLKEVGVEVQSMYPAGEPHGFDQRINGPESGDWETVVKPIIAFVEKHTGK